MTASVDRQPCISCGFSGPFNRAFEILVECPECHLIFADTKLTDDEVRGLYSTSYFLGEEYLDYLGEKEAIQRSFHRKMRLMTSVAPRIRRIYEIGAAYGFFGEVAEKRWEYSGIEISSEPARYAREALGLDVQHGDFFEADVREGYYDTFCMWDTIEHLVEPDQYIGRIAELIVPGGHLFVSTGDIGALVPRVRKAAWRMIHPPSHLFYFSRKTITDLLAKHGFMVRAISSIGVYRTLQQTLHGLLSEREDFFSRYLSRLVDSSLGQYSFYLNLGDIMFVAAEARASEG